MKPSELVEQIAEQVISTLSQYEGWDFSGLDEKKMKRDVQTIIVGTILDNGFCVTKQS
jgi:hypothetical protein